LIGLEILAAAAYTISATPPPSSLQVRYDAEARRQVVELQINTLLLESEAAKRRMSPPQLYQLEIARKVPEPTPAEIDRFIQDNRSQLEESDPAAVRQQVVDFLKSDSEAKLTDEFIKPISLVDENQKPLATIQEGDVVICFNFRTDRCREITHCRKRQDLDVARRVGRVIGEVGVDRERDGIVPGSLHVPRTVLEWRLDPVSAHRLAEITDHDREIVVMCSEGYASSLVAATLVGLGYTSAADLDGGFQAWAKAGLPVRHRRPRLRAAS